MGQGPHIEECHAQKGLSTLFLTLSGQNPCKLDIWLKAGTNNFKFWRERCPNWLWI